MASLRIHEDWLAKLAFDVDVTAQMNERNAATHKEALQLGGHARALQNLQRLLVKGQLRIPELLQGMEELLLLPIVLALNPMWARRGPHSYEDRCQGLVIVWVSLSPHLGAGLRLVDAANKGFQFSKHLDVPCPPNVLNTNKF
ncbi:hypothetical protein CCH79_00008409 [Gambusia affinis]|uniref:Uncharacterized protein n=1 Tax=Gambusia affinis TaxID=33528 RepID=A0A315UV43_GAMAF|nr:hypothetical protein CCH79_00008409 [Gambusia affinis]